MSVMASYVAIKGFSFVDTVTLSSVALAVVVAGVVLEVIAASDGSTVSSQSFLLGGRTSLGGPRLRLGLWEGSVSSITGILPFEESPSYGLCSLCSVKCVVLLVSDSSSSSNCSVSHFDLLAYKTMLFSRRSF